MRKSTTKTPAERTGHALRIRAASCYLRTVRSVTRSLVAALSCAACAAPQPRPAGPPAQPTAATPSYAQPAQPGYAPQTPQPDPSTGHRHDDLAQKVDELDRRVRILEQKSTSSWSCEARCGHLDGEKETYTIVTSTGGSAAEALDALVRKCSETIYTQVRRTEDRSSIRFELVPPSIRDACTRN